MMTRTSSRRIDDRDYYESDGDDRREYDESAYYGDLHQQTRSRGNHRRRQTSFLNSIPLDWLIGAGSLAIVAQATQSNSLTTYLLGSAWLGFCALLIGYADRGLNATEKGYKKFLKNYGSTGVWGVVFGVFALTTLFFALAEPSHAQFLFSTEKTVKALFTANATADVGTSTVQLNNALGTVFTGLRGILIIALLYGAYKVFMARDDQEDLKMQARMPILLLVVTTIVDVTAKSIAGEP